MQKTICAAILLVYLSGFCMIHEVVSKTINVEPTSLYNPLVLTPDFHKDGKQVNTTWNLIAPLGSRVFMECTFYVNSCEQVKIVFSEIGTPKYNLCPTKTLNYTYQTKTNELNISITNNWYKPGVMCKIFVTIPYINQPEIIIDSSEYGRENKVSKKPSCRCGWTNKSRKRIVGGNEAEVNEYPFMVILYDKKENYYYCDGSIITNRHVLSAAHCTFGMRAADVAVNVGEHDIHSNTETRVTVRHDVVQVINHADFDKLSKHNNDVSILVLKNKIKFNQYVGPVCMPEQLTSLTGEIVKIMGYGLMSKAGEEYLFATKLMESYLKVIDYSVCELSFNHYYVHRAINNSQLCTYITDKGLCQGDSGGPVLRLNPETNMFQQVGIVSYTGLCASLQPSGSASVAYYLDWIKEQVAATGPGQMCF